MLTSIEQLGALPITKELVYIKALYDEVWVRLFSGASQDKFEEMLLEGRTVASYDGQPAADQRFWVKEYTIRLVALSLCDETGHLLCREAADLEVLGGLPATALTEIAEHVRRINKLDARAEEVVDESAKNLDAVPSGAFGSD